MVAPNLSGVAIPGAMIKPARNHRKRKMAAGYIRQMAYDKCLLSEFIVFKTKWPIQRILDRPHSKRKIG